MCILEYIIAYNGDGDKSSSGHLLATGCFINAFILVVSNRHNKMTSTINVDNSCYLQNM